MVTRNTPQRMKILQYLKSVHSHPTAEIVYNAIKADMPTITLATVYRNLNLLAESGEILRLEINKEFHYDAYCNSHQHFVCENTGKIYDLEDNEITELIKSKINSTKFNPKSVSIIIRGTCN